MSQADFQAPPAPRRWLRYSLRTLLVAMTVVCLLLGCRVERAIKQKRAVDMVRKYGGEVRYEYQPYGNEPVKSYFSGVEPWAPGWLRQWLGDDLFMTVTMVTISDSTPEAAPSPSSIQEAELDLLADLRELVWLDLNAVPINDRSLVPLARLNRLQHLSLNGTQITDEGLKNISRLTDLRHLEMSRDPDAPLGSPAGITDRGLAQLKGLKKLDFLLLLNSRVTDRALDELPEMEHLTCLFLCFAEDVRSDLQWLARLPKIQQLSLERLDVTAEGWKRFAECRGGSFLQLIGGKNTVVFEHTDRFSQLTHLGLFQVPIAATGLETLANLEDLYLCDASVSDKSLEQLVCSHNLRTLSLDSSSIEGRGLCHLSGLQSLRVLSLSQTKITDEGLAYLPALPKLDYLMLCDTAITDAGLQHLQSVTASNIYLQGTKVTEQGANILRQKTGAKVRTNARPD